MPRFSSLLLAGLIASSVATTTATLAVAQTSAPRDEDKAAARALATQGAEAVTAGRFTEAIDLLRRAESILHAPTHLLLLARAQAGAKKLVAARETYLRLEREELAPNAPAAFRNAQTAGKEELAAIEPRIASLRVILPDSLVEKRVTVTLDDAPVPPALVGVFRPIDPGPHVIAVTPAAPGIGAPSKTSIDLKEGEKKELTVSLLEATAPVDEPAHPTGSGFLTPMRIGGIAAGAVGLGLVITGAVFTASGFSAGSKANKNAAALCTNDGLTCPNTPEVRSEVTANDDLAAKDKNVGIGLIVGGAAALGAGAALFVLGKPAAPATVGRASVEPFVTPSSLGLRGRF